MPLESVVLVTYKLSPSNLQRITGLSPEIKVLYTPETSEIKKHLPEAEILFGDLDAELFPLAKKLKWVQLAFAGVDQILFPEFVASNIVLTTCRGLQKDQLTELLFGMMLTFTRKLDILRKLQANKKWDISPFRETDVLHGKTIGILGLGSIGSEMAKVAKAFGMRVIGFKKHSSVPAEHVDLVVGKDELHLLYETSDHIVVVLPLTAETRNLITRNEFDLMGRSPYFYNFARGAIVIEADLIDALRQKKISGAGLDVFENEPLKPTSPLWEMENVIITPHIGGLVPSYMRQVTDLFLENLERYLRGKRLMNMVDKTRGY